MTLQALLRIVFSVFALNVYSASSAEEVCDLFPVGLNKNTVSAAIPVVGFSCFSKRN